MDEQTQQEEPRPSIEQMILDAQAAFEYQQREEAAAKKREEDALRQRKVAAAAQQFTDTFTATFSEAEIEYLRDLGLRIRYSEADAFAFGQFSYEGGDFTLWAHGEVWRIGQKGVTYPQTVPEPVFRNILVFVGFQVAKQREVMAKAAEVEAAKEEARRRREEAWNKEQEEAKAQAAARVETSKRLAALVEAETKRQTEEQAWAWPTGGVAHLYAIDYVSSYIEGSPQFETLYTTLVPKLDEHPNGVWAYPATGAETAAYAPVFLSWTAHRPLITELHLYDMSDVPPALREPIRITIPGVCTAWIDDGPGLGEHPELSLVLNNGERPVSWLRALIEESVGQA